MDATALIAPHPPQSGHTQTTAALPQVHQLAFGADTRPPQPPPAPSVVVTGEQPDRANRCVVIEVVKTGLVSPGRRVSSRQHERAQRVVGKLHRGALQSCKIRTASASRPP